MGQALYRKYRSKSLREIVGQEHVTTTLANELASGAISHAYLFTGPRGVGKTSIARILAHEVNGLPYDEDRNHLDIIEIDAASNRRIDEIRDLRDKVHTTPTTSTYKVYIIDEVHMLTKEAFNALLKTLEEPPAHVIFILATTEAHKLPETIVSRTQRFTFKPITPSAIVAHLKGIAKQEKIAISSEALGLIAEHSEGTLRDSISLLDQAASMGKTVELVDAQRMLGLAPDTLVAQLLTGMLQGTPKDIISSLEQLREQGAHPPQVAKQLSATIRQRIIDSPAEAAWGVPLIEQLLKVPAASDAQSMLEIALLGAQLRHAPSPVTASTPPTVSHNKPAPKPTPVTPDNPKTSPAKAQSNLPASTSKTPLNQEEWQHILAQLKSNHNTLYGILRMAQPVFEDDTVALVFAFPFHQKRLQDSRNQQIVQDVIKTITGRNMAISCRTDAKLAGKTPPAPTIVTQPDVTPTDLSAINTIFGSAEVLES